MPSCRSKVYSALCVVHAFALLACSRPLLTAFHPLLPCPCPCSFVLRLPGGRRARPCMVGGAKSAVMLMAVHPARNTNSTLWQRRGNGDGGDRFARETGSTALLTDHVHDGWCVDKQFFNIAKTQHSNTDLSLWCRDGGQCRSDTALPCLSLIATF